MFEEFQEYKPLIRKGTKRQSLLACLEYIKGYRQLWNSDVLIKYNYERADRENCVYTDTQLVDLDVFLINSAFNYRRDMHAYAYFNIFNANLFLRDIFVTIIDNCEKALNIITPIYNTNNDQLNITPNDLQISLAKEIYYNNDWQLCGILADSLEDSGCIDYNTLEYLRNGYKFRGYWLIDRILNLK